MSKQPKKRKLRRALFVIFGILLVLCVVGWFWLNSFVQSKVENQLVDAGFADPQVGSVLVGFGGITATNIKLSSDGITIDVEKLIVNQSIFELAGGEAPVELLEISGGEIEIDSEILKSDSDFSFADLDLASMDVPVNAIAARDVRFKLFDDDGAVELAIDDADLVSTEEAFELTGNVTTLDGKLELNGDLQKQSTDLEIKFTGKQLHLVDQQWQRWPGIGPAVLKHLGADSTFDTTGVVNGNLKTGIKYLADVDTKDAWLYIPKFDLPIAIHSAEVKIQDGLVTYEKVVAGLGDDDIVNGTGTTTIDGLPCRSKFEGDFSDVEVSDLRKLVKEIPIKVFGTATGDVIGSVDVDEALETTLRIDAQGDTSDAGFGSISASSGSVDVQIQPLVLTQTGKTVDLQGAVTVKATTSDQNVDGVLETFDLQALDRQFEFEMLGSGEVDLVIPLNSAADLRTWTLEIASISSKGSVGGMPLQDLKIRSFLDQGQLVFSPTTAKLASDPNAEINVKVRWPLPNQAAESISDTGIVEAGGINIPPVDAIRFFSRQMKNAEIEYEFEPQIDSLAESGIKGSLNFTSKIELPSGSERPIDSWNVAAAVSDSTLNFSGQDLSNLVAGVSIKDGVLSVSDLNGQVATGGNIAAGASLNLATNELSNVELTAMKFPASWLAGTIIRLDSSGEFVNRTGLNADNVAEKLKGAFDAKIWLDPKEKSRTLWKAASAELTIFGKPFEDVEAAGKFDDSFDIKSIKTKLPGGGNALLEGDWIAGSDDGKFKLQWKGAALVPLLESQFSLPDSFASFSDGDLEISFEDSKPIFSGRFDLVEPEALGGTFPDHSFEVETIDGRIHFRDRPGRKNAFSLVGSFSSTKPYDFEIKGRTKSMPLSTATFDKLAGLATSKFDLAGRASPWEIKTSGAVRFEDLSFDNASLSNIRSMWNFDTSKPDNQRLKFEGFGGVATLDSSRSKSDDLVFKISEVELAELAAFRKLPVKLSGSVTGNVKIKNWRSADKRSIVGSANGKDIRVGRARLARAVGKASLTGGGKNLQYSLESQLLDGKLECTGDTEIDSISNPFSSSFPVKVRLVNGRLSRFAESISTSPSQALKQLEGRISLSMDWEVTPGVYPKGSGVVSFEDVKYKNRLVSRKIFSDIFLDDGIMQLKRINADLRQGEIAGRAVIPLIGSTSGSYDLDVRNFSLPTMLQVLLDDPVKSNGLVNARISGRTGRTITGSGTLGVSQAGLFGVANQSMKVPVRFRVEPTQRKARIEIPNTRFRAFRGTVDGKASLEIGSRLRLESKMELSNIDSQLLVQTLSGFSNSGNGKLSGKLELSGRNIRTEKDLVGSFRGKLEQSNALSFPLLDQASRFLGNAATLRSGQFDSDSIDLALSKGRVNVKQFRLQSALVSIFISGDVWLNGKLDLGVAARVERLDQPTLIDQLAGSPIARVVGPQAALIAQAAEFLSERVVFLDVSGTAKRPQFRLNPGKQLQEEAIRYFLRGSQIFPNGNVLNN